MGWSPNTWKVTNMMELNWGKPLTYVVSRDGDTKKFTTIEQARYWLHA